MAGIAAGGGLRIEVEPAALIAAGRTVGSLGRQLDMLSDALGAALSDGIASGLDPAGVNFAFEYGRLAQQFAEGLANGASAFKDVGFLLEATGFNYANADAVSTIGGGGPPETLGNPPDKTIAGHISANSNSAIVPPPPKFRMIAGMLGATPIGWMSAAGSMTWPSGNPGLMRVTAAQWRNFARGFAIFGSALEPVKTVVRAQTTPETAAMLSAMDQLAEGASMLANASVDIAGLIEDFASQVQETQDAIRRLLDRLSIGGLFDAVTDTVGKLFGSEGDSVLLEVVRDVRTVLENFQRQVKGVIGLLEELSHAVNDAATAFQKWIRGPLVAVFGEQIGGALASRIKTDTDLAVGAVTGLIGTVTSVVALADADTWKGLTNLTLAVGQDPTKMPEVLAEMGKTIVAWDKWSGEHPGRAAGEALFNIGSFFLPAGVLAGTTRVTTSLGRAASAFGRGVDAKTPQIPAISSNAVPPLGGGPKSAAPGTPGTGIPGRGIEPAPSPAGRPPAQGADVGHGGERAPIERPTHETVLDRIENTAVHLNNLGVSERADTEERPAN